MIKQRSRVTTPTEVDVDRPPSGLRNGKTPSNINLNVQNGSVCGSVISVKSIEPISNDEVIDMLTNNKEITDDEPPIIIGRKRKPSRSPSLASIKSKISQAWNEKVRNRSNSVVSVQSVQSVISGKTARMLAPAETNIDHAYIPLKLARDYIMKIVDETKGMKTRHVEIVHQIDDNYRIIENETQSQFNVFVVNLKQDYQNKVSTFKQIIQVHRVELRQKEQYWDEVLASLAKKNHDLMIEKRKLLILNKVDYEQIEKEREITIQTLTKQLDEANAKVKEEEKKSKVKAIKVDNVQAEPIITMQREPTIIVKDLGNNERLRMDEERFLINDEREKMLAEWHKLEDERDKLAAEQLQIRSELEDAIKNYDKLQEENNRLVERTADYEVVCGRLAALSAVSVIGDNEKEKAEEEQKEIEIEKKQLTENIENNGDDNEKADMQEKLNVLNAQLQALQSISDGKPITPPPIQRPATAKTIIKIVERLVPDPEAKAALDMAKDEIDSLRKQILAMKNDRTHLQNQLTALKADLQAVENERDNLKTMNDSLENAAGSGDTIINNVNNGEYEDLWPLIRKLQARVAELEEIEVQLRKEIIKKQKIILAMEEDIEKLIRAHAQYKKKFNKTKRLLEMVVNETRKMLVKHFPAAQYVDSRLFEIQDLTDAENLLRIEALQLIRSDSIPEEKEEDESIKNPLMKSDEEFNQLQSDLDDAEAKIRELENKLRVEEEARKKTEDDNSDLLARIAELERLLAASEKENQDLKLNVKELKDTLEKQEEKFQKQMKKKDEKIKDMQNDITKLVKQYEKLKKKFLDGKDAIMADRLALENQLTDLETENDILNDARNDFAAHVNDLNDELARLRKELKEKKEEIVNLNNDLKKMEDEAIQRELDNQKKLKEIQRKCDKEITKKDLQIKDLLEEIKKLIKAHERFKKKNSANWDLIQANVKNFLPSVVEKDSDDRLEELEELVEIQRKQIENLQNAGNGKLDTSSTTNNSTRPRRPSLNREETNLKTKVQNLEKALKEAKNRPRTANRVNSAVTRSDRLLKECEKKLQTALDENKKLTDQQQKSTNQLKKKDEEISGLKKQIGDLEKDVKKLQNDNKELAENFNSERLLRRKYYNQVEDMKGKIRVYCRVRPMSEEEIKTGTNSIVSSSDEYTISLASSRGEKEFQFDTVFLPDHKQEKVFEDTNNLIQSAVDGFNVCIFAYGQTGSGKTFTIIGDREGKHPGIAPRAFDRIFELIAENSNKFTFQVSTYMLELYNDRLIDLFSSQTDKLNVDDDRLEIKKDKKGLVYVQGAEVKSAKNAKELYALFEEGSKNRHTASTKMNSESSRSHLVLGVLIESRNRANGQIIKGKLSLVDLAGSERAAKTGAGAQQLKEAMSINKSLSALGDVISALSSEQQFIPYRNNKLTMLMQDSLGGNAKTLMFVNISPSDYNGDESVVSLTYAARVKLITNDATKNTENKEINRLKAIINRMKKGTVDEKDIED